MSSSKSVVAIVKGTDHTALVEEVLDLLGGASSMATSKSKVFLMPNAGHKDPPESGVNTTPDMITACVKAFQKANPKEISVGEAGAVSQSTVDCFEGTGIAKATKDAGAKLVDLKEQMLWTRFEVPNWEAVSAYLIPSVLVDPDIFLVNVPILKFHGSTVITGALKNVRPVQDYVHREMHFRDLNKAIAEIASVCRPHLHIVEAMRFGGAGRTVGVIEGGGPRSEAQEELGVIVAGTDPVAVDATCCRILGINVEHVDHIRYSAERGLGTLDENQIEVRGKSIKDVFRQLDVPYLHGLPEYEGYKIYDDKACSSCIGLLLATMEWLKPNAAEYEKNKGLTIVIGPKKELPAGLGKGPGRDKDLILMGNCVAKFRDKGIFVAGCPPRGNPPRLAITTREDQGDLEYDWDVVERDDTGGASILPQA